MKKICIFAEFPISSLEGIALGRGGGQAATWLPQLAKAWESQTQYEIHWAIYDRSAKQMESRHVWNQTFHRIPSSSITSSLLLGRWPHRLAAAKLFRKIKPDLIHCWGTETLNGAAFCDFKGPSILSMQGVITTYYKTGDLKGWRWELFRHWESLSIRKATIVTSESRWGMDRVEEIIPNKTLRKVEYGVHPSFYEIPWQPDELKPRILFVGGLNRLKGVDILLEMLRQHPNLPWKMVFVGNGYLAGELKSLNATSVEVLGVLKTQQIHDEMAKAWALVMPSRADTSPNVVKEARVIGLPVVGSPSGGHAEYIQHGIDGFIIPGENPEDWYQALNTLATDFKLCRTMGGTTHEYFRDYFRPERTADSFLKLYREIITKSNK